MSIVNKIYLLITLNYAIMSLKEIDYIHKQYNQVLDFRETS